MMAIIHLALLAIAVTPSFGLITDSQKIQILNVFNQARRTTVVPAADMKILQWDDSLAQQAQAFTDMCQPVWYPLKHAWFAYWDRMPDPVDVAKFRTLRMAPYFDYETGGCINTVESNKTCRHPENYEAIVISTNERVGCGMTTCWPEDGRKANFHACVIGVISGSPVNEYEANPDAYAWKKGPRCSACPAGWNHCLNGLCSKYPATANPGPAPTTKAPTKFPTRRKRRG